MAKKKSSKAELTDSVHKIWLAGLGAFATAEEEGNKLFNALVARGKKYERSFKKPVDKAATKVKGTMDDFRQQAGKQVRKIEKAFDDQIDSALHRVGVPSRKEIAALTRKVDKLTQALEGKPRRAAKKKTTRKTTRTAKKTAR
jgi:poly(hydroxyalkanoate) granule-associated protein